MLAKRSPRWWDLYQFFIIIGIKLPVPGFLWQEQKLFLWVHCCEKTHNFNNWRHSLTLHLPAHWGTIITKTRVFDWKTFFHPLEKQDCQFVGWVTNTVKIFFCDRIGPEFDSQPHSTCFTLQHAGYLPLVSATVFLSENCFLVEIACVVTCL